MSDEEETAAVDPNTIETETVLKKKSSQIELVTGQSFTLRDHTYKIVRPLGRGGMGGTMLGHNDGDTHVAIKYAFKDKGAQQALLSEQHYLTKIRGRLDQAVRMIDYGTVRAQVLAGPVQAEDEVDVLIMERLYTEPCKYFNRLKLPADLAIDMFVSWLHAVQGVHSITGIAHGDIALKNCMIRPKQTVTRAESALYKKATRESLNALDRAYAFMCAHREWQSVFIDFGCASGRDRHMREEREGTVHYLAPEALLHGDMDQKRDVYAIMVSFMEILTGERPYHWTDGSFRVVIMETKKGPPYRDISGILDTIEMPKMRYGSPERLKKNLSRIIEAGLAPRLGDRAAVYELLQECNECFEIEESTFKDHNGVRRKRWQTQLFELVDPEQLLKTLQSSPIKTF